MLLEQMHNYDPPTFGEWLIKLHCVSWKKSQCTFAMNLVLTNNVGTRETGQQESKAWQDPKHTLLMKKECMGMH